MDAKLTEALAEVGGSFVEQAAWRVFRVVRCSGRLREAHRCAGEGRGRYHDRRRSHVAVQERPADSNIRIAPSLPPVEELEAALDVFTCCVKLAYTEKLLRE